MGDYKISLGAILDANAKGDLQKSINAIKDLNVKISKAELSQSAIADIKRQFEQNGIDLKVVFGNTSQITNQAKQAGQQIGEQINQGLSQSMGNSDAVIERFKKSLSNTGMDTHGIDIVVNRLKSLDVQIDSLNQKVATSFSGKNYGEDILSVDVSGVDKMGQAVKIVDQYNLATGEYLKTVQSVSTAHEKAGNSVEEFANKQKKVIASLQNDYNKVLASSLDTNASRPITSDSSFKALEQQIDKVEIAMSELKNSTATTFDDAKIKVQDEISALKILEKQLRNADNVSTKLRGNSVDTGFGIAINDLEKLKADSKEYSKMSGTIQNLERTLENVSDSASLNKFNDSLREARSELAKLKSEAMANNRAEKVGINVSDFQSKIDDLKRISPEISDFKAQINGAEVSIESLASELGEVKTQGDISVLNTKWRAFTDAAKAAGIAIKETATSSTLLQDKVNNIQFKMDNGHGISEYQNRIIALEQELQKYGVSADKASQETAELRNILGSMQGLSGEQLVAQAGRLEKEFAAVKITIDNAKLSYDKFNQPVSSEKVTELINRINTFLTKNTRITKEARTELEGFVSELNRVGATGTRFNQINQKLKETENSMRGLHRLGAGLKDQFSQAATSFAQWLSVSQLIMLGINKTREAITEFKELDTILTEISKTSDLTTQQLKELGETSFDSASKYGKKASDYLTGVQEMSRSGFYGKQGEAMAEQSLLAQAAGDIDADTANKYVLATNAAYKFKGEAEKINEVLDGQNMITNRNSVALSDMATAMSEVGTVASEYRVPVEDLSAMIGTIEAVTKSGGSEGGNAIKAILINLQNVTSSKIVDTLNAANASMTEMVGGAEKLRNPINILRDLSKTFNELDEDDPLRAEILTNIGQKYHAAKLSALLSNMDMYDKMLKDYSEGEGSAFAEAEKSANNLE